MDEGDSGAENADAPGDDTGTESGVSTPESKDAATGDPDGAEAAETDPDDDAESDGAGETTDRAESTEADEHPEPEDPESTEADEHPEPEDPESTEADDHEVSGEGGQGPETGGQSAETAVDSEADAGSAGGEDTPASGEDPAGTGGDETGDDQTGGEETAGHEPGGDVQKATEVDAPADEIVFDPEAGPHEPAGEGAPSEPAEAADSTPPGAGEPHAVDGGETPPGDPREEVPVPGGSTPPSPASPDPGGEIGAGAPDDEEMPLAAHIEEMIKRLGVVIVIMAIVSAITFPFADSLINFLWYSFLPGAAQQCPAPTELANSGDQACPRLYHPLSLMLARLKTASLLGLVIALPVFVYQTYLFMRPGLYPNERRYYLAAVPTSLVLAGVGIAFAYFLVLPVIFTYFLGYSMHAVDTIAFSLSETFDLILLMMGLFAVVFQIPLFMMLAIMMGVTTRRWLVSRRIYFWGGFLGIAFLFSPDPTGMAPFIVAITMVLLFEGTLLLLRWTGR